MGRPPKRKAAEVEKDVSAASKQTKAVVATASSSRPRRTLPAATSLAGTTDTESYVPESEVKSRSTSVNQSDQLTSDNVPIKRSRGRPRKIESNVTDQAKSRSTSTAQAKQTNSNNGPTKRSRGRPRKNSKVHQTKSTLTASDNAVTDGVDADDSEPSITNPSKKGGRKAKPSHPTKENAIESGGSDDDQDEPSYWLMKAEPESRIEKGVDVKFSIDDLVAATSPEPWDGVRNAVARNNMRAMMKGDFAFFYHSNCKVPGVVGIMEVVQEHSVDESAFDPAHPYYDEKSTRDKPKWCVVHVQSVLKFADKISLRELQKYSKDGGVLQEMQLLKMSRLSVSKVRKKEWDFILSLVDLDNEAVASARRQPNEADPEPVTATDEPMVDA